MSATEHEKDHTAYDAITNLSGVMASDGDDRQLPGIGYRLNRATLPPVQELPAQRVTPPKRGQVQLLLTGVSTLVPIAAFAVSRLRQQRLPMRHDDRLETHLTRHGATSHRVSRPPTMLSRGRYRLSLVPSLLLGALLGGGATLFYLSRKNAATEVGSRESLGLRQPKPAVTSQQSAAPTITGAVKEAAVTMVGQAQDLLSEARSTSTEQAPTALNALSDGQHTALAQTEKADTQPAGTLDETIPRQAAPVTAASKNDSTGQLNAAPVATLVSSEQQSEAVPASSAPIAPSATEEVSPLPEHLTSAVSVPDTAKRAEKTPAASPQRAKAANEASAAATGVQARIKEHMPVLDGKGMRVGAVDRVEASGSIKLTKDGQGKHHWLPLRWVTRVDTQVHLSRTAQQVRREWKTSAPRAH